MCFGSRNDFRTVSQEITATMNFIGDVNENLIEGRYDPIQSGSFPFCVQEELSCYVRLHC